MHAFPTIAICQAPEMMSSERPEVSVLIATHNGANYLPRVLDGYLELGDPGFAWEMVIVDNASTDRTGDIIAEYAGRLPIVSCFEGKSGKNRALNRGLEFVRSDVIILSDDDAIPHDGFLNAWRDAFQDNPKADLFGATIIPSFDVELPGWMGREKRRFEELYSRREGVPNGPIDADYIFGPNMAVRRRVIQSGIHFDEGVGPQAGQKTYAMGSETAFCRAVAEAGFRLEFVDAPSVSHIVRANQVEIDFVTSRARRMGYGTARKHFLEGRVRLKPSRGLRQDFRAALNVSKRALLHLGLCSPSIESRFEARWQIEFDRGYQMGVTQLRAEGLNRGHGR